MSELPAPKPKAPSTGRGGSGVSSVAGGKALTDPSKILSKARESINSARQDAGGSPASSSKTGVTGSVKSVAASAAQGAAGGDTVSKALGGGAQGAIYSGVKSALSKENRGNTAKVAALAVAPMAVPFVVVFVALAMVVTMMTATASSSSGSAISTSVNAAKGAGVTQEQFAQYVDLQSQTNVPWQILAALYQSQSAGGGACATTPSPSSTPTSSASATASTSSASSTNGATCDDSKFVSAWQVPTEGLSSAQVADFKKNTRSSTAWVAQHLQSAMYDDPTRSDYMTLSAGLRVAPGSGSKRSIDSDDPGAQATQQAWTGAIASLPLGGMSPAKAQSVFQTALAWYLGNSAPPGCDVTTGTVQNVSDPTATSTGTPSATPSSAASTSPTGTGLTVPPVGTWPRRNSLNNPPLPIPADFAALYKAAAAKYGLPWSILAGIGMIETGHGSIVSSSPTGAAGPMAFLPTAWAEYGVLAPGHTGSPNRLDPADAIYSAGNLVSQLVKQKGSIENALLQYGGGGAGWYVGDVLYYAGQYDSGAVGTGGVDSCSGGSFGIGEGTEATCGDGNSRGLPDGALVYAANCWYGGLGVPIYANGGSVHGTHWQCTELVRRFWKAKGWAPQNWTGGVGKTLWNWRTPAGAISEPQGAITKLAAGDILSMAWGSTSTGHVGIVNFIKQTGPGQWRVQMASQNTPQAMWYGTWDGKSVTMDFNGFPVTGVMHHLAQGES